MREAQTAHAAEPFKPYPYQLQHCGVHSPIDFDGSLWDPVGAQSGSDTAPSEAQLGELVNATSGTMTLIGPNGSLFRTKSGLILGLARHAGQRGFNGCD
jgi:hypothetical protein